MGGDGGPSAPTRIAGEYPASISEPEAAPVPAGSGRCPPGQDVSAEPPIIQPSMLTARLFAILQLLEDSLGRAHRVTSSLRARSSWSRTASRMSRLVSPDPS